MLPGGEGKVLVATGIHELLNIGSMEKNVEPLVGVRQDNLLNQQNIDWLYLTNCTTTTVVMPTAAIELKFLETCASRVLLLKLTTEVCARACGPLHVLEH